MSATDVQPPTAQSDATDAGGSRWLALLRVGSIRFSALYFAPFYGAIEASGHGSMAWAAAGIFFCTVLCLGIELLNRVTDQTEDRINNPIRTAQCERFTYQDLGLLAILIFAILVPVGFAWLFLWGNLQLFLVHTVVWLIAWNYSFGLRLKASRYISMGVLGGTFLFPFLCGWAMFAPVWELPWLTLYPPLFGASVSGAKDLTDVLGDLRRGYRSVFVELAEKPSARPLLGLLLLPHLYLGLLLALGGAPMRAAVLFALLPAMLVFAQMLRSARTVRERRAVRELTYHLWLGAVLATLGLMHPTAAMAAALVGTAVFWWVATRHLHWQPGLGPDQRDDLRVIARRLRPDTMK